MMDDDMQELKETMAGLVKRVDKLTATMNIMKELVLRKETSSYKKGRGQSHVPKDDLSKTEEEAASVGSEHDKDMWHYRKLELLTFNDEDSLGWLFRIERYFQVSAIAESKKLGAGIICLEGRALNWYQWKEKRMTISNWDMFKHELLKRFHSSQLGGEYRVLFTAKQEQLVLKYVEEFDKLSIQLEDASEGCLIGAFLNGPRPEVQAELKMVDVKTIDEVIVKAVCADEKQQLLEEEKGPRSNRVQQPSSGLKPGMTQPIVSQVIHSPKPSKGLTSATSLVNGDTSRK